MPLASHGPLIKKGTVISTEFTKAFKGSVDFTDPTIRQRLILFLEALEIMALTAHTCTSAFTQPPVLWSPLPESRLDSSVRATTWGRLSFQLLMHSVIHLVPCHSLKNIFLQLDDILIWGYYLLSIDESYYPSLEPLTEIAQKVRDALSGTRLCPAFQMHSDPSVSQNLPECVL